MPLFLSPQSLFKIPPETDALFARVLSAAPSARLVMFEGRHPALTAKFRARAAAALGRAGAGGGERLIMLPQCGHDDYMRINGVCDAMLDTLRWSGGNTSLDALAAGLPIVSCAGRLMRCRQSAAMLRTIGLYLCVASTPAEAVSKAIEAAADGGKVLRGRIAKERGALFDRREPLAALEEHLIQIRE